MASSTTPSVNPNRRGSFIFRALSHKNYQLFFAGLATSLPGLRREVRPIYARIGILPELAEGIHHTSELSIPPES